MGSAASFPSNSQKQGKNKKIDAKTLERFLSLEDRIQQVEATDIRRRFNVMVETLHDLNRSVSQYEDTLTQCKANTLRLKGGHITDEYTAAEQNVYTEAVMKEEITKKELDGMVKHRDEAKIQLDVLSEEYKQLSDLYKEQDALLDSTFDGRYGSHTENRLEEQVGCLMVCKQRVDTTKLKWINACQLLESASASMKKAVKKWKVIGNNTTTSRCDVKSDVTVVRDDLLSAHQDIINAKHAVGMSSPPYCAEFDMEALHAAVENIYTSVETEDGHEQAMDCFQKSYQQAAALLQWKKMVIDSTIDRDLKMWISLLNAKTDELREERVRLIREEIATSRHHLQRSSLRAKSQTPAGTDVGARRASKGDKSSERRPRTSTVYDKEAAPSAATATYSVTTAPPARKRVIDTTSWKRSTSRDDQQSPGSSAEGTSVVISINVDGTPPTVKTQYSNEEDRTEHRSEGMVPDTQDCFTTDTKPSSTMTEVTPSEAGKNEDAASAKIVTPAAGDKMVHDVRDDPVTMTNQHGIIPDVSSTETQNKQGDTASAEVVSAVDTPPTVEGGSRVEDSVASNGLSPADDAATDEHVSPLNSPAAVNNEKSISDAEPASANSENLPCPVFRDNTLILTPMATEKLAPPPDPSNLFGDIAGLRKQHLREMTSFERQKQANRQRAETFLQDKLAARRSRREQLQQESKSELGRESRDVFQHVLNMHGL